MSRFNIHRRFSICFVLAALPLMFAAGCASGARRRGYVAEPPLEFSEADGGVPIAIEPSATRDVTMVDRHPLLSKPRDFYESSGNNKLVKAAAATFIGIPAGILGEARQIVVGKPPSSRY